MADEILINKSIDGLPPCVAPKPYFPLPIKNIDVNETQRIDLGELLTSGTSQDFTWVADHEYGINEAVTWNGKWYQSQEGANTGNIPGTDITKWVEINKSSSGFVFHAPGVYPQDEVFVLKAVNGMIHIFHLTNATRPYVSSDFTTEYEAGDWEIISSDASLNQILDTSVSEIMFDFQNKSYGKFKSDNIIDGPRLVVLNNDLNADEMKWIFTIDDSLPPITFPGSFQMSDALWELNNQREWQAQDPGKYLALADKDESNWLLRIIGPFSAQELIP